MMAEQTICRHSEIWTVKRHSLRVLPTKQLVGSNIAFIDTVIYGFSLKGSVMECHIIQNRWTKRIASRREVLESLIQVFQSEWTTEPLAFTVEAIHWETNAEVEQQRRSWKERHWKRQTSAEWRQ